jgi:hypothetical protein
MLCKYSTIELHPQPMFSSFEVYRLVFLVFHRDTDTLVGLPRPIHESVKTLKQVNRVGSQSSRIENQQGKLDYQDLSCRPFGQLGKIRSLYLSSFLHKDRFF